MILSHRHRFIFFHNPKAAGMSMRAVLARYHDDESPLDGIFWNPAFDYPMDFAHLRLWEITALFPAAIEAASRYRSLILVRDPYRRFVSALDQHLKTHRADLPLATMEPAQQLLIAETFVDKFLRPEMARMDYRFVHFSPQVWFLQSDGFRLPGHIVPIDDGGAFVARGLECLGLPPCAVPHENRSRLDLTHLLRSPKIRAFVRDFYAEDFAFFAADPSLAHLAGGNVPLHTGGQNSRQSRSACNSGQDTSRHRDASPDANRTGTGQLTTTSDLAAVSTQIEGAAARLTAGRPREAFDCLKAVLADHAGHPGALGMLGQIAVCAGRPAIGLAPLQHAVALDPRLEHRVWLALWLAQLGCPEDAVNVISATETISGPGPAIPRDAFESPVRIPPYFKQE